MPGICGVVSSHQQADALGAEMASRLANGQDLNEDRFVDDSGRVFLGRVSLGIVNTQKQPATNVGRSLFAVMDGEIYDYAAQRRTLEANGHRFATDGQAELLIVGFQHGGQQFFRGLHGKFIAAFWDGPAHRLVLVNDRFGMKPLYHTRKSGRFLFASTLHALFADQSFSRRTDTCGLAQMFAFGHLIGDDTLVEGVRVLPGAAWVVYDAEVDRLSVSRYWRLETPKAIRSAAEALDRIDTAFGHAVDRCTIGTSGLGLSLSGGMDARTILARAAEPGHPLATLTVGMAGNMDQGSASAMAKLAGCPHHQVILGKDFLTDFENHLRQMVRITDGQYLCQCIVMPTLSAYRDLGIRVLLRGHAGELMHMSKAYSFSLDRAALSIQNDMGLTDWLWRHLRAHMTDGIEGQLFVGIQQGDVESLAKESLQACINETKDTQPIAHRIWHLFLTERLRREIALSLVEFDTVVETRLPYLDNELIDELFAAPPELKLHDTIQTHILRRHRPDFLKIVNVNTGTVVGAGTLRKSLARFRTRVFSKLGVSGYQPYERLGLWLRRELRPLVERLLLDERCLDRGVFDPQTTHTVVKNHLSGRRNHTFLVLAMMIFEESQREFVDTSADPACSTVIANVAGLAAQSDRMTT